MRNMAQLLIFPENYSCFREANACFDMVPFTAHRNCVFFFFVFFFFFFVEFAVTKWTLNTPGNLVRDSPATPYEITRCVLKEIIKFSCPRHCDVKVNGDVSEGEESGITQW